MTEAAFRRWVVKRLKQAGAFVYKAERLEVGFPDEVALAPGGRLVFLELKAAGGKLRPAQERAIRHLRGLGFRAEVLSSRGQVEEFIADWLGE